MRQENNFTEGKILGPLVRFALPVLFAIFLQSMYGAVDLLIVGQFATSADVSGVATGAQIMLTMANLVTSLSMGITILLGQQIGRGEGKRSGKTIGSGILLIMAFGLIMTVILTAAAAPIARIMHAPPEAFGLTVQYIRICGFGFLVLSAFNLLGSIFRGLGDSRTPLVAVAIACVCNIGGDLLLVAVFHMGTRGVAIATVAAQLISVLVSLAFIRRRELPFTFTRRDLRFDRALTGRILKLGTPIALQDFLVGISFLVILAVVNSLGLIASAGIGVAEKVTAFIMLVPIAFLQSMSAFVAQNVGAKRHDRASRTLRYGILLSLAFGVVMFTIAFFHGDLLTGIFSNDPPVIAAGFDYLRAYAIDTLLISFLFCFIGYFNGYGLTRFVMLQGIFGAFAIRIPVSILMSRRVPVSLFAIGMATPISSVAQITLCFICYIWLQRKLSQKRNQSAI